MFAALWAISLSFAKLSRYSAKSTVSLAVVLAALYVLMKPRDAWRLLLLCALHSWELLNRIYKIEIHYILEVLVELSILGAAVHLLWRTRSLRLDAGALYRQFTPAARWIGLMAFFFAGFAKLNTDFLDPEISCATSLYQWQRAFWLFRPLPETGFLAEKFPIYFAIGVEIGVPILLLFRRTRTLALGLMFALVFLLATNFHARVYTFSTPVMTMLLLFAPPRLALEVRDRLRAHWGPRIEAVRAHPWGPTGVRIASLLIVFAFLWLVAAGDHRRFRYLKHDIVRTVVVLGYPVLIALWAWGTFRARPSHAPTRGMLSIRPRWLTSLPLVLFLNESIPYVGLTHPVTLGMAANLYMHDGWSNHVVFSHVPSVKAGRMVYFIDSSDPNLEPGSRQAGLQWIVFSDYMARHPEVSATYEFEGQVHTVKRAGDHPEFKKSGWVKLLRFRRILNKRWRKNCGHKPPIPLVPVLEEGFVHGEERFAKRQEAKKAEEAKKAREKRQAEAREQAAERKKARDEARKEARKTRAQRTKERAARAGHQVVEEISADQAPSPAPGAPLPTQKLEHAPATNPTSGR